MWYGPPNWALTSPMLGSLQYLKLFLIPSLQAPMALTSHLSRTLAWACVDNTPIKLWRFPFYLQLNLNSSLTGRHYCSKWRSSSSALGIRSLKELQPQPHKSLKRMSLLLTYEVLSDMFNGRVAALPPTFPSHHPASSWVRSLWPYWQPQPVHSPVDKLRWNTYS